LLSLKSPGILLKGLLLKVAILEKQLKNTQKKAKHIKKTTEQKQSTHSKTKSFSFKSGKNGKKRNTLHKKNI